jgi:HEAT repeat protein
VIARRALTGELELQQVRIVRRAGQHGLGAQLHALLARLEDPVADLLGLRRLVAHVHDLRPHAALAVGD